MYREISDLGLFVPTSPYGLGLYKKDLGSIFSVHTSRSVNKKLIIYIKVFETIKFELDLYFFFCVGIVYSGEYDVCDVTLSVYPHRASLKNMPGHGGNRTYDLWNTSPMLCQLSYAVRIYYLINKEQIY